MIIMMSFIGIDREERRVRQHETGSAFCRLFLTFYQFEMRGRESTDKIKIPAPYLIEYVLLNQKGSRFLDVLD